MATVLVCALLRLVIRITIGNISKEFNAGFDLSLTRSGRIRVSADVYNRTTVNLFFDKPLSIFSGFYSASINGGSVT